MIDISEATIGAAVKLNTSPAYGECSDYVHRGEIGVVHEIGKNYIAIRFQRVIMAIEPDDLDWLGD